MDNITTFLSKAVTNALIVIVNDHNLKFNPEARVMYFGEKGVDYTFRSLISLCKTHNEVAEGKITVDMLANLIINVIEIDKSQWIIKVERNNLNFSMTNNNIENHIEKLLTDKTIYNKSNKKILVDFSSPNIAKDMHVGHLRSTIIGDSICRLFECQSNNVLRTNHIGDFGLQFGMLIQYFLETTIDDVSTLTTNDLQDFYAKSKERFDADEEFKKNAYQRVVELQNNNPNITKIWEIIKGISKKAYDQIYYKLNITLDEVGESFYQQFIPNLIKELEEKNLLEEDNGRKVIRIPNYNEPLTIIKTDNGLTYDTTDLAAIQYRLINLNVDEIYYVVDCGQSLHFELIFEAAKLAGWVRPDQVIKHIKFGLVLDSDGKRIRSRNGDTIKLSDLLDEAIVKTTDIVINREEQKVPENYIDIVIKNIAYGAIKYADLSSTRTKDYMFSFDKMLKLNGNTAPYLLYAYVRITSILRKANYDGTINKITITTNQEAELCKFILRFPEVIEKLNDDLMFHMLCGYFYKLSEYLTQFITHCQCIDYDVNKNIIGVNSSRIMICEAARMIMKECFIILGIETIDKM